MKNSNLDPMVEQLAQFSDEGESEHENLHRRSSRLSALALAATDVANGEHNPDLHYIASKLHFHASHAHRRLSDDERDSDAHLARWHEEIYNNLARSHLKRSKWHEEVYNKMK